MVRQTTLSVLALSLLCCAPGVLATTTDKQKSTAPPLLPLVILGSGPAGLTAAQYGARLGIPTTIFSGPLPGGLLTQTAHIENYSGVKKVTGEFLIDTMIDQTREAGVTIEEDIVVSVDLSTWPFVIGLESGAMYRTLSMVIATGATPKKLGVPGEETFWGDGVSSCALCDALFFKDKDVFVVGGGDSAVEEAIQLAPHVKSVTILVRRGRMRAAHNMKNQLSGYPNIKPVEYNKRITKVIGTDDGVTGLEIHNLLTDEKGVVPADGLFLAIGQHPNSDLFVGQLSIADNGHIIINGRTQETSVPGVFAAGDVEDKDYRQAILAAGRGCAAAIDAVSWLRENGVTDEAVKKLSQKES